MTVESAALVRWWGRGSWSGGAQGALSGGGQGRGEQGVGHHDSSTGFTSSLGFDSLGADGSAT